MRKIVNNVCKKTVCSKVLDKEMSKTRFSFRHISGLKLRSLLIVNDCFENESNAVSGVFLQRLNIKSLVGFVVLVLFVLSFTEKVNAQQDPMFTQYNFNVQTYNAAYCGTWGSLGFLALGRYQWTGIDGAPTTYTFSMQAPIRMKNFALGFSLVSDKVGLEKHTGFFGDYSYGIQINRNSDLRLGLKGGISHYTNSLTSYDGYPDGEDDPANQQDINAKWAPNFGVGVFLHSERYYLGLSIPKIVEQEMSDNYKSFSQNAEMRHFYLVGGYVFNLSETLRFKPTFLVKATSGSPVQVDLTANFLIKDKVWLGGMYRFSDSYGFIAQWVFDKRLRIGYSIDFTTTELRSYQNGTHEIMVSYEFNQREKWATPRMY